jgi:undecaprenyl pyrophosphate phosphatase UppP
MPARDKKDAASGKAALTGEMDGVKCWYRGRRMKMRGRKIAYWVCAVLLMIATGWLVDYADSLEKVRPSALTDQVATAGVSLFIGAYIALYKLLPVFGRGGRWRVGWSRVVVGALLVALGLIFRLYFSMGRSPVTGACAMLIALGGYLLAASAQKIPAPEEAQADGKHPDE